MIYGLDHLGLAKYQKGLAAREHPQGWALGCFGTGVFGDSRRAVMEVLDTGRCPLFRLQALWDDDHRFDSSSLRTLQAELRKWRSVFDRYTGKVAMCVSPFCEHEANQALVMQAFNICKQELPSGHFVNSPIKRGAIVRHKDIINEVHNTGARDPGGRFFFSYDGTNSVDSDIEKDRQNLKRAEVFFLWNSQCNGRWNVSSEKDPTKRPDRKAFPNSNQIDSWIAQSRPKGATQHPKSWGPFKSHADQHKKPDNQMGRCLYIAPRNISLIELRTPNGQVVARAKRGPVFDGDASMCIFRFGEWGYLLADKARRISGSELCQVFADGKRVGIVNPIFRDGSFR